MNNKKYLVTGGTGFIGSALVKKLIKNGSKVRVLDNNSRGASARLSDLEKDVDLIISDIRDEKAVKDAASGMDAIIHLAYINGTEFFYTKPELVLDVAVKGMSSVINACKEANIGELILASSSEVYQSPEEIPSSESVPLIVPDVLNPRFSYGGGKIISELMAINYGRKYLDKVVIFRPHNVYGPDMGFEHVLPQLTMRALDAVKDKKLGDINFEIQGDGSQTRAFTYIDDFVNGVMCLLNKGQHLNIYHIGNPEEIKIIDAVNSIFKILKKEPNIINTPLKEGSTERRCPKIDKIKKIGFKPEVMFDKGLPLLVNWYKNHHKTINI